MRFRTQGTLSSAKPVMHFVKSALFKYSFQHLEMIQMLALLSSAGAMEHMLNLIAIQSHKVKVSCFMAICIHILPFIYGKG